MLITYIYIYTHIIFTYKYTGLSSKPGQIATRIIPNLGNPEILSPVFDAFEAFILFWGIVFTVSKKNPCVGLLSSHHHSWWITWIPRSAAAPQGRWW